jgi:hypothetical protein
MSRDVEADAHRHAPPAERAGNPAGASLYARWVGSVLHQGHKESEGTQVIAGSEASEADDGRHPGKVAKMRAFIRQTFKLRKTKLPEANHGYTADSFDYVSKPLPVEDIFISARTLNFLRMVYRGIGLLIGLYALSAFMLFGTIWVLTVLVLICQWKKVRGIGNLDIPTVRQLWSFHRYPQWCWVSQLKLFMMISNKRV